MADPSAPVPPSDKSLLARVRDGSQDAATTLHARYAQRLLALARAKCGNDLAARVDAEDVVQSVFGSFFRGASKGYYDAPTGDEIWGLLLVIALNKIRAKGRHHHAARRDVRRTVGTEAIIVDPIETDEAATAMLRLVVEEVIGQLPEGHRELVRLRLEGFEVAEIATKTGRSKRTTERVLQEFRTRMTAVYGEGGE
jgi:RNA polymerase sigma-70 factor (ECF subfamily)